MSVLSSRVLRKAAGWTLSVPGADHPGFPRPWGSKCVACQGEEESAEALKEDGEVPCLACSGWRSRTGGKVWGLYVVIPPIVIEAKESPEKNMWEDSGELNHPFWGKC